MLRSDVLPRLVRPEPPLTDGVVTVRWHRGADVPDEVAAACDVDVARYTGVPFPYREADAREWFDRCDELLSENKGVHMVIAEAASDRLVGSISLQNFTWEHHSCEIGYWIGAAFRGHGWTSRAVRLVTRWGFGAFGLDRVSLLAEPTNLASQRVAERCGFQREGVLRSAQLIKGRRRDLVIHSLLPSDLR